MITQAWQKIDHESAPGMSNLAVFKGQSTDFNTPISFGAIGDRNGQVVLLGSILHSEEAAPGTWHWPEFVPPGS